MAAKKRVFKNHVHIMNPKTAETVIFEPGDDEPDWSKDLENPIDDGNFVQDDDVFDEDTGEYTKERPDYSKISKDRLYDMLNERDLDKSAGTKEDFVARLQADDAAHG